MLDSPNYGSLDRFAFEARRVEIHGAGIHLDASRELL